jgi:hypothetical protein
VTRLLNFPAQANTSRILWQAAAAGHGLAFPKSVILCRPKTLDDVAEAVRLHEHVKASGEGHSWNMVRGRMLPSTA